MHESECREALGTSDTCPNSSAHAEVIESSDPHQIFQIGGHLIRRPAPDVALIKWFSAWGDFYKSCKFMSGVMRSGSDSSRVIPLLP